MSEGTAPIVRRHLGRLAGIASVALVGVAALALLSTEPAAAQAPPATEAQALAIERQLMCPQCPNERLDTCERAVCRDMKRIIRKQLEDGRTPDEIILFFESRYGPIVRARLAPEGFNLLLFAWVGGAMLAVAAGGGWYLWTLLRRSSAVVRGTGALDAWASAPGVDDAWLDRQLADAEGGAGERR